MSDSIGSNTIFGPTFLLLKITFKLKLRAGPNTTKVKHRQCPTQSKRIVHEYLDSSK